MTIESYISSTPDDRQALMNTLHGVIISNDNTVLPVIKPMMGVEMILYEQRCYMKYGLASTKKYLSLHCMPIYMNPALHAKYAALLPLAKFQKGCINFNDAAAMPPEIVAALIAECSLIDIAAMLENRKKKSK